jgi:hypothetical protein
MPSPCVRSGSGFSPEPARHRARRVHARPGRACAGARPGHLDGRLQLGLRDPLDPEARPDRAARAPPPGAADQGRAHGRARARGLDPPDALTPAALSAWMQGTRIPRTVPGRSTSPASSGFRASSPSSIPAGGSGPALGRRRARLRPPRRPFPMTRFPDPAHEGAFHHVQIFRHRRSSPTSATSSSATRASPRPSSSTRSWPTRRRGPRLHLRAAAPGRLPLPGGAREGACPGHLPSRGALRSRTRAAARDAGRGRGLPGRLELSRLLRASDPTDPLQALELALEVHRQGIGHLHAHFATSPAAVAALAADGWPGWASASRPTRRTSSTTTWTRHALGRPPAAADAVVTVSDFNVADLRRRFGSAADGVRRIYNGLDLELFPAEPAPTRARRPDPRRGTPRREEGVRRPDRCLRDPPVQGSRGDLPDHRWWRARGSARGADPGPGPRGLGDARRAGPPGAADPGAGAEHAHGRPLRRGFGRQPRRHADRAPRGHGPGGTLRVDARDGDPRADRRRRLGLPRGATGSRRRWRRRWSGSSTTPPGHDHGNARHAAASRTISTSGTTPRSSAPSSGRARRQVRKENEPMRPDPPAASVVRSRRPRPGSASPASAPTPASRPSVARGRRCMSRRYSERSSAWDTAPSCSRPGPGELRPETWPTSRSTDCPPRTHRDVRSARYRPGSSTGNSGALADTGPFDLVYQRYALWSDAGMRYARCHGIPASSRSTRRSSRNRPATGAWSTAAPPRR